MVFQIHDEIILECPKKNSQLVSEILKKIMVNSVNELRMDIKMKCDVVIENRWGEIPMSEELRTKYETYKEDIDSGKIVGNPLTLVVEEYPNIPEESIKRVVLDKEELRF